MKRVLTALAATLPFAANAADAISGAVQRQPTNWQAIVMFLIFVIFTLGITYWASKRVRSRNDYYTAGGNITGFQNGLAIAGDYMSAASFLGISALVFTSGYDGLIYSLGFLVGWRCTAPVRASAALTVNGSVAASAVRTFFMMLLPR